MHTGYLCSGCCKVFNYECSIVGHLSETVVMITGSDSFDAVEKALITLALAKHNGDRTNASKILGISTRTLQRRMNSV